MYLVLLMYVYLGFLCVCLPVRLRNLRTRAWLRVRVCGCVRVRYRCKDQSAVTMENVIIFPSAPPPPRRLPRCLGCYIILGCDAGRINDCVYRMMPKRRLVLCAVLLCEWCKIEVAKTDCRGGGAIEAEHDGTATPLPRRSAVMTAQIPLKNRSGCSSFRQTYTSTHLQVQICYIPLAQGRIP